MDPAAFLEKRTQIRIEEQMERILAGARRLTELPTTRASTKEKLLLECANVRTALQELVAVYVNYVSVIEPAQLVYFDVQTLQILDYVACIAQFSI
jgi:hypothetical protein